MGVAVRSLSLLLFFLGTLAESAVGARIAPGFLMELRHPDDPKLNGKYRVNFNGELRLPYDVKVKAANATIETVRQRVADAYKPMFTASTPAPSLELAQRTYWLDVRGLIAKPGRYLIQTTASLDEIISLAGGLGGTPKPDFVRIGQGDDVRVVRLAEYYADGNAKLIPPWRGGDRLFFQREASSVDDGSPAAALSGRAVTLMGEVRTPGEVIFKKDADLLYYLARAGGPTSQAKLDEIEVTRYEGKDTHQIELDAGNPEKLGPIVGGDVLVIRADRPSDFDRKLPLLSAVASVLSAIAVLIIAL